MFRILKKEQLAENIWLMDVEAPRIAKHALPGQFLIVRLDAEGERIPLTVCYYDPESGVVQIVFQVVVFIQVGLLIVSSVLFVVLVFHFLSVFSPS